jgi:hypothetical protein
MQVKHATSSAAGIDLIQHPLSPATRYSELSKASAALLADQARQLPPARAKRLLERIVLPTASSARSRAAALNNIATAHHALGDTAAAEASLWQALRLDPENRIARLNLEDVVAHADGDDAPPDDDGAAADLDLDIAAPELDLGDRCDFETVEAGDALPHLIEARLRARRPLLVRGLTAGWAAHAWFSSSGGAADDPTRRHVRGLLARAQRDGRNIYSNLDLEPAAHRRPLRRSYDAALGGALPNASLLGAHCYADMPSRWILTSGARTGSQWHVDPLNTSAWNALLRGGKRWARHSIHTLGGTLCDAM